MKTEILLVERDRANDALRESEQRYKRLLSAITDYIYTVSLDHGESRSTYHGPGCEAVTGFSPDAFARDPYLWYSIIHEQDRPRVLQQIDRILKGEVPSPLEHRIICRNGTVRWIRNTTIPHQDANGKLVAYDGLISDITERKKWEQALEDERNVLRTVEERLSLVIRGSNDGIWDWNVLTGETYFSPRWKNMLGYADDEIINRFESFEELIHPDDRPHVRERIRAYLAGELPTYEVEMRMRHKNGTYRWILARGVVLLDANRRPVRMAGSHMDVTEHKRAAEQLQKANLDLLEAQEQLILAARFESMGTLAAGVAHEVKNPLQTILMGLHFLSHKLVSPGPDVDQTLRDMKESVTRANAIISDLLTLSRVTPFQIRSGNLNHVVQQCLRLIKVEMDAAGVMPRLHLASDLPSAPLDEAKMEQVFLNVFLNAIQAMPSGGTLTVTTCTMLLGPDPLASGPLFRRFRPGQHLVVAEVRDTGIGVKPCDLPRLFDPFFTTKPVGVGTGLGLSITRMIIDRHGGAIDINNAPEGGVLVTIALKSDLEGQHEPQTCPDRGR